MLPPEDCAALFRRSRDVTWNVRSMLCAREDSVRPPPTPTHTDACMHTQHADANTRWNQRPDEHSNTRARYSPLAYSRA
eukprot:4390416-Pleurochrysis_carterae.AAC.1